MFTYASILRIFQLLFTYRSGIGLVWFVMICYSLIIWLWLALQLLKCVRLNKWEGFYVFDKGVVFKYKIGEATRVKYCK